MKVLILDAVNNYLRCYSVIPTLDLNGSPNGGVCGFLSSLNHFVELTSPDKVILVWDGPNGSRKRRSIIKEYKQGRRPTRLNRAYEFDMVDDIEKNKIQQRIRLDEYLNDLPVNQVCIDDTEADDIIGYLAKLYDKDDKIIVSGDHDFYQLLDDRTQIYQPRLKKFYKQEDVYVDYGIHKKNFLLARAITGDKSDNLKGIKGVQFTTLKKLMPFFCEEEKVELDQVLKFCEENGEKYKRFLDQREVIISNLKVMQLDFSILSPYSIQKIHDSIGEDIAINMTAIRVRLMQDGIKNLSASFFQQFKILSMKRNGL